MLYPTCFLVFFRGEELSLLVSYGGIFAATIFSTDQFSDFLDISLHSLLCGFLCFLCQLFHICLFVSSDLSHTPFGFYVCRRASLYLTQSLADLLSLIFFFSWCLSSIACHVPGVIHSFFFLVFCIPRQVVLASSKVPLTCFHC